MFKKTCPVLMRCLLFVLAIALLTGSTAGADGIFPSMDQLFGTMMPSVGLALGRTADSTSEEADGLHEIYEGFTDSAYWVFGVYLAGAGAEVTDTEQSDREIRVALSVYGAQMDLIYDWEAQRATVVYPAGTRPEAEKQVFGPADSILPPVRGAMPSLGEALGRYPDEETDNGDGSTTEVYQNVTEEDFSAFGRYLEEKGAALADYRSDGKVFSGTVQAYGKSFFFSYQLASGEARVTYPEGTRDAWLAREAKLKPYKTVGGYVTFGTYPQTESGMDKTPIEWLVLEYDEKNNRALLLSRYGLDAQPYHKEYASITWEECTLRSWLNGEFLNKAFSGNEQGAILLTAVENSKSQGYWSTNGGNNTQDKVFLLSCAEANRYLNVTYGNSNNTQSRVLPTAYAKKNGAWTSDSNKTADGAAAGAWWLRSPGYYQFYAAFVNSDGSLYDSDVHDGDASVRPALWINLESDIF